MKDETMLKGTAVRDYTVQHETYGVGVERLQNGAAVSHALKLDLSPGIWFLNVTVTVGVSNVSVNVRMKDQEGVKTLGGHHNGAMSPHFSPATVTAFFDGVKATNARPAELIVSFESVGPNAIPILGQRSIFVMAWKHGEPVAAVAPAAAEKKAVAAKPAPAEKAEPVKPAAKAEDKPAPAAKPVKAAPVAAAAPAPAKPAETAPAAKPAAKPAKPAATAPAAPAKSAKPAPAKKSAAKRK
jgi:hypothetical protein